MTLIELSIALSVFGSAVVGVVAGWGHGVGFVAAGFLLGPLIGLATVCLLVFLPGFLVAKSSLAKENGPRRTFARSVENIVGTLMFLGILMSAPASWSLTVGSIETMVRWFSG